MTDQQNDQSTLINEYIKNLANKVNELQAENILLKTRLSLLETAGQEEQATNGGDFGDEEPEPEPAPEPKSGHYHNQTKVKENMKPGSQKKRDKSGQFIKE